jgi:hypothetical protein
MRAATDSFRRQLKQFETFPSVAMHPKCVRIQDTHYISLGISLGEKGQRRFSLFLFAD